MRTLVHGEQGRGHGNIDILPEAGRVTAVQCSQNSDHRLESGVDVGMGQTVGARLRQHLAIVSYAVLGKSGFRLHGRRIGHATAPRTTLAIAGNRGIDQPRIAFRKRFVVEAEKSESSRPKILHDDVGSVAELERKLVGAWNVQVDADVALPGILLCVVARHPVGRWKRKTRYVRARRLDLDNLGAEVLKRSGT